MKKWQLNGIEFTEDMIGDNYGFIYSISVQDSKGKITHYIGKKAFSHKKKTKLSTRARKGTRKRVAISKKDSGWQSYNGSCKPLLDAIRVGKVRIISKQVLKLCTDKQSLNYWEVDYLCEHKVLFNDLFWNGNILARYFKGKIKP